MFGDAWWHRMALNGSGFTSQHSTGGKNDLKSQHFNTWPLFVRWGISEELQLPERDTRLMPKLDLSFHCNHTKRTWAFPLTQLWDSSGITTVTLTGADREHTLFRIKRGATSRSKLSLDLPMNLAHITGYKVAFPEGPLKRQLSIK